MSSIRAAYNDDLVRAHHHAIATLSELLATETDRTERRKLANALLRARPAKEPAPPSPGSAGDRADGSEANESRKSNSVPPHSRRSERADEGASMPSALRPARRGDRAFGSEADESWKSANSRSENDNAAFAATDEGTLLSPLGIDNPPDPNEDTDELDELDDSLLDPDNPQSRQIAALAHEAQHGPDHLGALSKLREIMMGNFEALTPESGTAQAP